MGIIPYQKKTSPGKYTTVYMVVAEAINLYSGRRVQKKKRGISSIPKAERVYRELWSACRGEKPNGSDPQYWGQLLELYLDHVTSKVRSENYPLGFSPHLIAVKKSRLKHTQGWSETHLDLFTPQFVIEHLDLLEKSGASRSLTNHVIKEIKCVFSFATNSGFIKHNPFIGVKLRKTTKRRKEALTHAEANLLLAEAKKRNHPYYYIWLLTLSLGLRRSELAGLKWLDIDFDQGLVYLRRQKIPGEGVVDFLKDREERVVSLPSFLKPILSEIRLRSSSEFVINAKCHKWNAGNQADVLREFCKEIGIKEVTHHQLRATHITLALIDGVPLGIVKENVGHSKLSTTDLYFRSAGINMKGQLDGLNLKVPSESAGKVYLLKSNK